MIRGSSQPPPEIRGSDYWKEASTLGNILSCGLATFESGGKPDKGKGRLFRMLVLETVYLIWRLRNERRIRDNDGQDGPARQTNAARFKSNMVEDKLVKATWANC